MKTLGKIRTLGLALFVALGLSSCLDSDDSIRVGIASYMLQTSDEGDFVPQMRVMSNTPMQSVKLKIENNNFSLHKVSDYQFEGCDAGLYGPAPLDSVKFAQYAVTVAATDGKVEDFGIVLAASKKLGAVMADLEYENSTMKVRVDSVANATSYWLMAKASIGEFWLPIYDLKLQKDGEGRLAQTISKEVWTSLTYGWPKGQYYFAVGAAYGKNGYSPIPEVFRKSSNGETVTLE